MSYGPPEQQSSQPVGSQAPPPKGPVLGLVALVLGLAGVVATFLPMNLDGVRPYVAWAFGLPGFVVAILGLLGHRRGKAPAVIGALLSLLAVLVGVITIGNLVGVL
ncbi:hypothetical protein FXN61_23075 [Lentzea sp. PSKA42]|uniref:DUF4190 domain-containing protein n=1 Tax=Lentzea indica TaxID=2604800 RepID=A0ABX1FKK6_9PSEU|nr:hypothetical protein [Lentzea indica]NKE59534.1 hypothetical protein [Lentzea indica]